MGQLLGLSASCSLALAFRILDIPSSSPAGGALAFAALLSQFLSGLLFGFAPNHWFLVLSLVPLRQVFFMFMFMYVRMYVCNLACMYMYVCLYACTSSSIIGEATPQPLRCFLYFTTPFRESVHP